MRLVSSVLAASAAMLLAGAALAEPASIPAKPQQTTASAPTSTGGGALVAPGRSPDLEILFTGDVVGFLEPCG